MTALFTRRDIMRALGGAAAFAGLGSVISSCSGSAAALVLGVPAAPIGPAGKPGTIPWVARHDLTDAQYQAEYKRLVIDGGYRLADVCGYDVGGQARYGAIWEKRVGAPDTPDFHSEHAIRLADYQAKFDERKAAGERPVRINGYNVGREAFFATIWEMSPGPDWAAMHVIKEGELQGEFDRFDKSGYRLVDVCGYVEPSIGGIQFTAIWERSDGRHWGWIPPSNRAEYQAKFEKARAQGYRPVRTSGFTGGGEPRFTAVLEKDTGLAWEVRHGITSQLYQHEFDHVFHQPSDYRPAFVGGFRSKDGDRIVQQFSPVWEKRDAAPVIAARAEAFLRNYAVPGLSLAIAKDGKLVHAGAYGLAKRDSAEQVTTSSLFRIASVSKPITSVACFRLVEAGKLTLADKVFGTGGILGTTYGTKAYSADLQAITVQHLLEHTAGGWPNDMNDPMFTNPGFDHTQLITWVLDNRPLDGPPGVQVRYGNFGYCLLGRIIEKVSGQSYADYVQENVLRPCGITDMRIAGDTLAQRLPDEVVYEDQAGQDPYGIPVARMDSHGGWVSTATDLMRFAVRVDGAPTPPDILSPASITTMATRTTAKDAKGNPSLQAKGWIVDDLSWSKDGDLPGNVSILVRADDGYWWVALINTRGLAPANKNTINGLDRLMWKIRNDVDNWPAGQAL
jgi:CubicO group peptidase (beta-lactamase class C family)